MNFVVKVSLLIIGMSLSSVYSMIKPVNRGDQGIDFLMREVSPSEQIVDLSQALQKINLRDYQGKGSLGDNGIKVAWYDVIAKVESMLKSDTATYKDLMPLFNNMKDLSSDMFDAAHTGNADFREKKAVVERLGKKQAQVKRFLLGQKAKSFFSFGKKQEDYKKMRQLLLGMIDMLNAKIDLMKKNVK